MIDGVIKFRRKDFKEHKELFSELKSEQNPHTLFIGCSDSRLVPNLITNTLPGELFVIRNIANLVPKYRETEEYVSTTSAIEYAVQILNVENIVICGHSNCGGCSALYKDDEFFREIPHVRKWLELAEPVKQKVMKQIHGHDPEKREWLTEQLNVAEQIGHLFTYPFIREKFDAGKIAIVGWHYIIETGEVYQLNPKKRTFELIK